MEQKISQINFTFTEVFASNYAKQWGVNNTTVNPTYLGNAVNLIVFVLQPIRNKIYSQYKKGVNINGWFRSQAMLKAAAAHKIIMSDSPLGHAGACAADISVSGLTQEQLFKFIIQMVKKKEIEVDQLIWEKDSNCVHVGYVHGKCRGQIMIREYKNGKLTYTNYKG